VARQQHGYLSMQFTRSMQSLADEYGYIFKVQLADIDILDVVLNRRILVVLIPALEKAEDEAANLGKIVASCLKGMMGATLGNTVEGGWESAVGSKQTRSTSSFMTVFDEVGYYTTAGMAVMAAQARSLGFALVFATQDLPAMEKRIKTAAKSIVGNCNLKILGRIEDPTETKEFVTRHGGTVWVMETKGFTAPTNTVSGLFMNMPFADDRGASYQVRQRVDYDHLRGQREGEAHLLFGDWAYKAQMFYAVPAKAKALRVHRFLPVPSVTKSSEKRDRDILELTSRLKDKDWTAAGAGGTAKDAPEIAAMAQAIAAATGKTGPVEMGAATIVAVAKLPAAPKTAGADSPSVNASAAYGVSDDFDDLNAAPVAAGSNGTASSAAGMSYRDESSAEERAALRAGLPPMYEGDEFAIDDLDRSQAYAAIPAAYTPAANIAIQGNRGFAGTDNDLSLLPQGAPGEDMEDFSSFVLPEEIAAVLAKSAQKLNVGLRGHSDAE
jgi:hypothetical protein